MDQNTQQWVKLDYVFIRLFLQLNFDPGESYWGCGWGKGGGGGEELTVAKMIKGSWKGIMDTASLSPWVFEKIFLGI